MFGLSKEIVRASTTVPGTRAGGPDGGWIKRDQAIMGTAISVELWCDDRRAGEAAIGAVMDEMHRVDRAMSPHRPDSELSRINLDAASAPVPLSAEMTRLLVRAQAFSEL